MTTTNRIAIATIRTDTPSPGDRGRIEYDPETHELVCVLTTGEEEVLEERPNHLQDADEMVWMMYAKQPVWEFEPIERDWLGATLELGLFGRRVGSGQVVVLDADGIAAQTIPLPDHLTIYPVDSNLSVRYTHDEIVITNEDAEKIGLEIES